MAPKDDRLATLRATLKRSVVDRAVQKYVDLHTTKTGRAPHRTAIDTYRDVLNGDQRTDAEVDDMIDAVIGLRRRDRAFDFAEIVLVGAATGLLGTILYEYRALVPSILVVLLAGAAAIHFRDALGDRLTTKRVIAVLIVCVVVALTYAKRDRLLDAVGGIVRWVKSDHSGAPPPVVPQRP